MIILKMCFKHNKRPPLKCAVSSHNAVPHIEVLREQCLKELFIHEFNTQPSPELFSEMLAVHPTGHTPWLMCDCTSPGPSHLASSPADTQAAASVIDLPIIFLRKLLETMSEKLILHAPQSRSPMLQQGNQGLQTLAPIGLSVCSHDFFFNIMNSLSRVWLCVSVCKSCNVINKTKDISLLVAFRIKFHCKIFCKPTFCKNLNGKCAAIFETQAQTDIQTRHTYRQALQYQFLKA